MLGRLTPIPQVLESVKGDKNCHPRKTGARATARRARFDRDSTSLSRPDAEEQQEADDRAIGDKGPRGKSFKNAHETPDRREGGDRGDNQA
jgi:hypothetical protein